MEGWGIVLRQWPSVVWIQIRTWMFLAAWIQIQIRLSLVVKGVRPVFLGAVGITTIKGDTHNNNKRG